MVNRNRTKHYCRMKLLNYKYFDYDNIFGLMSDRQNSNDVKIKQGSKGTGKKSYRYFKKYFDNPFPYEKIDDNDNYDILIQIGEGNNLENFKAHSDILRKSSNYFDTALSPNWAKKEGIFFYI
jgi:hypothetical protein